MSTWQPYPDVDDVIHDWLKSLYEPYRLALVDPSVLPATTVISWDSYWAGTYPTSFMVVESNPTNERYLGLGSKMALLEGIQAIRVTHRWISKGKPPIIKHMREFIAKTIRFNVSPLPSTLTNAGIREMIPIESQIYPETRSAQEDFWTLEYRILTKVLNTVA
jgi:hypothetical protein